MVKCIILKVKMFLLNPPPSFLTVRVGRPSAGSCLGKGLGEARFSAQSTPPPPVGLKGGCKRFIVSSIVESGGCGQVGFMVVTLDSHIYVFSCGK